MNSNEYRNPRRVSFAAAQAAADEKARRAAMYVAERNLGIKHADTLLAKQKGA